MLMLQFQQHLRKHSQAAADFLRRSEEARIDAVTAEVVRGGESHIQDQTMSAVRELPFLPNYSCSAATRVITMW
jgi:hypothetical protein